MCCKCCCDYHVFLLTVQSLCNINLSFSIYTEGKVQSLLLNQTVYRIRVIRCHLQPTDSQDRHRQTDRQTDKQRERAACTTKLQIRSLNLTFHLGKLLVTAYKIKSVIHGMIKVFPWVHHNSRDYEGVMCLQTEGNLSIILCDRYLVNVKLKVYFKALLKKTVVTLCSLLSVNPFYIYSIYIQYQSKVWTHLLIFFEDFSLILLFSTW